MRLRWMVTGLLLALTIAHADYQFETVFQRRVGPGVTYERIVESTQPWRIDLLQVDLRNPNLSLEAVKGQDKLYGREGTLNMARRKTAEEHYVLGAINADFYNTQTGEPINAQVVNGEMVRRPSSLSSIGFDVQTRPSLARAAMVASVVHGDQAYPLN